MPRYLVERTFPDGLAMPVNDQGAQVCLTVTEQCPERRHRVHSYITPDKLLHLRIPHPGCDPPSYPAQQPAGGSYHRGHRTGSLLLQKTRRRIR